MIGLLPSMTARAQGIALFASVTALAIVTDPALATDLTGDALAYACAGNVPGLKHDKKAEEYARFCNTYINGWDDARMSFLRGTVTYCPPQITVKALSVVFFDYMASHEEARQLPAADALMLAFKAKWPCR